jgi:molecular chaperone GrpE (heat shock protein)
MAEKEQRDQASGDAVQRACHRSIPSNKIAKTNQYGYKISEINPRDKLRSGVSGCE